MTATVKVDKKVPIPENRGTPNKYPFESMEIGDSFFFASDKESVIESVRQCSITYGKRHQKKFTTRKLSEAGKAGIRVWRIALPEPKK